MSFRPFSGGGPSQAMAVMEHALKNMRWVYAKEIYATTYLAE
jgi:hypothetical protein